MDKCPEETLEKLVTANTASLRDDIIDLLHERGFPPEIDIGGILSALGIILKEVDIPHVKIHAFLRSTELILHMLINHEELNDEALIMLDKDKMHQC